MNFFYRFFTSSRHQHLFERGLFYLIPISTICIGLWFLNTDLGMPLKDFFWSLITGDLEFSGKRIPSLVIGGGLVLNSFGLFTRSRVAWLMSLFLLFMSLLSIYLTGFHQGAFTFIGFFFILNLFMGKFFDRSSIIASTLFAFLSFLMLMIYATFGNLYLANHFSPAIEDITTAFYFSIVTMSTVGYGDISPKTPESKLFVISVILIGLTLFATSLTTVIMPMVKNSLNNILNKKGRAMKKEDHFVVIGNSFLAINTCEELEKRGFELIRIISPHWRKTIPENTEELIIFGDPSSKETLDKAFVNKARSVLVMMDDDSENAFVTLAVKEISKDLEVIVSVNDSGNLQKVKLVHPDIIISPQLLGGELAAKILAGEEITSDFVMEKIFQRS